MQNFEHNPDIVLDAILKPDKNFIVLWNLKCPILHIKMLENASLRLQNFKNSKKRGNFCTQHNATPTFKSCENTEKAVKITRFTGN